MDMFIGKSRCSMCNKEKRAVRCEGCLQLFCYEHLSCHRQELNKQLDSIETNRDLFRQTLHEQRNQPEVQLLIKQINKWEQDSIKTIQETANDCRQVLVQHRNEHFNDIEINLARLTDELRDICHENDFNEIDLNIFNDKLKDLQKDLDKLSNYSIQQESTPLIFKISVVACPSKYPSTKIIPSTTRWKQSGVTIAGGYGEGCQLTQLYWPYGICVDEDQTIYIADYGNHRIVKWKNGAKQGHAVAGDNGKGNRRDQLNLPTDVILDKKNDAVIVCDAGNRRVVRWCRRNGINQQILISNIACSRITLDNNGDLYVSDWEKNEVRRWRAGDTSGVLVAGGNGPGDQLNQLNSPSYIVIDEDESIYIADTNNHRVVKWAKGATEGIVVAGGHGQGNALKQLSLPQGLVLDQSGTLYIADCYNDRIVCWQKGCREGRIILGGNGQGQKGNQFNYPDGLAFDQHRNLYVVDWGNNRVQKFDISLD